MSLPLFKKTPGGQRTGAGRKPLPRAVRKGYQINVNVDAACYSALAAMAHETGDTLSGTIRAIVDGQLKKTAQYR